MAASAVNAFGGLFAMVSRDLMTHKVGDSLIPHRITDGYINATLLCQACGKCEADYRRLGTTNEFLQALSEKMGIPIDSLVQVEMGRNGGTWVHPQVAIHLGQWCSPRFAVLVSGWVIDWMHRRSTPPQRPDVTELVYVRRLSLVNQMQRTVPEGHWTVFEQCSHLLILVEVDLKIPVDRYDLLDGSVGSRWSTFRKDKPWALERTPYLHTFPDHRGTRQSWAYRLEELAHFERWLRSTYKPIHLPAYLESKYYLPVPVTRLLAPYIGPMRIGGGDRGKEK
jgi:hypothetical protein